MNKLNEELNELYVYRKTLRLEVSLIEHTGNLGGSIKPMKKELKKINNRIKEILLIIQK